MANQNPLVTECKELHSHALEQLNGFVSTKRLTVLQADQELIYVAMPRVKDGKVLWVEYSFHNKNFLFIGEWVASMKNDEGVKTGSLREVKEGLKWILRYIEKVKTSALAPA